MEMKYDSYYEKEIPYKMTMEELVERQQKRSGFISEEDLLAYIRYCGEKVRFYAPTAYPESIMPVPFMGGMALVESGHEKKALCRIVTGKDGERYKDSAYNPLVEGGVIQRDGNWYCAYKMSITPVEFKGVVDSWYVSDFCSAINRGNVEIWELEDEQA